MLTDKGLIAIEDIQLGDFVLAKDTKTDDITYKEVITLFERVAQEGSYTITVEGEELTATPNHPFWVDGKGWLRADELTVDDFFIDEEGNLLDITAIEIDQTPLVVYNFEVEDYHTYFVGQSNLLTHNLNPIHCDPFFAFNKTHDGRIKFGSQRGPNGGLLQSHHVIQENWAIENLSKHGYKKELAPTITLETARAKNPNNTAGVDLAHTIISKRQNARRDVRNKSGQGKWNSTLQEELEYTVGDLKAAGFSNNTINVIMEKQYDMLKALNLEGTYRKVELK